MPPASLPTAADVAARSNYQFVSYSVHGWPSGGEALDQDDVLARSLYLYVNQAVHGQPSGGEPMDQDDVLARVLYLYVNIGHDRDPTDVLARALYQYLAYTNDEIFPWIMDIQPREQYHGGQVSIYGDGFGASEAAEGGILRIANGAPPNVTVPGPGSIFGIVSWSTRSVGLWPANTGAAILPAIVGTVPPDAQSGMVSVELTT